jgi:shikimate kinase/3-dehydroquinate synthase
MRSVKVELGERSYEIIVGSRLLEAAADYIPHGSYRNVVVIADANVDPLYSEALGTGVAALGEVHKILVAPGETSKSLEVAGKLCEQLAKLEIRRQDLVVTLGGGVVSDLGGFVASIYQRGIAVAHVPTTLLGQVDAAIGGKTGVNLAAGKNLVGTFWQPAAVLCDVSLLNSLPYREFRSGLAEVIKYGLCYERGILDIVENSTDGVVARAPSIVEDIVYRSAAIKARVVSNDETDFAGRTILNYGHTFGHALEAAGGYTRWLHGEAISVGMMFAAQLAEAMGILPGVDVESHRAAFQAVGLPTKASFDPDAVIGAWSIDKKFLGSQRWVLLEGIGHPVIRSDVKREHIDYALSRVLQT